MQAQTKRTGESFSHPIWQHLKSGLPNDDIAHISDRGKRDVKNEDWIGLGFLGHGNPNQTQI